MTTKSRFYKYALTVTLVMGGAALVAARRPSNLQDNVGNALGNAAGNAADNAQGEADLVLINGKILTVDAKDSIAEAVGIRDGKIVAVGTKEAVMKRAAKNARVMDLHGRTATPGLIDTHGHFQEVQALYDIDLNEVTRIDEVVKKVREKVAAAQPGEWIRGAGWDEGKLAELRYITAADLDKVAPANPVWLLHTMGHYGVANSYAMKLAHITRETKSPANGTIDRDAAGQPTGVLKEFAMEQVMDLIPPFTHEQEKKGLLKIIEDFNKEGMTAVKDPGIEQPQWDLYREVLQENKLTVRVSALWLSGQTLETAKKVLERVTNIPKPLQLRGDGILMSGGIKLHIDGSGGARTAWMHQEWNKNYREKDTGNYGYPSRDPQVYREQVRLFHDAGIHVSTHAIGDRAIDWVVDTYAQVLKEKPTAGLRHGIIHCNIPSDHAIDTMAALQKQYDAGYPEAQAPFMWWIGDTYAGNFGPERSLRLMPFQTYLRKGMIWAGGSDYYVTPLPARFGIWASIVRKTLKGVYGAQPFGTAEAVDVHAALRSYTSWAARQLFLEDRIGSIEPGKDADIAVWDRDMYTIPADDIQKLKCEMTLFRGKVVYRAAGTPIAAQ